MRVVGGSMSEALWVDEYRIDSASQKMLRMMRGGSWQRGSSLRDAAGLSDNSQVFYRVEEYLKPAGLVEERARRDEKALRKFQLTEWGREWVEEHGEEIVAPSTREEIAELAHEGYKAGTSAKESVQAYRKKISRIKNRIEETREDMDEIADQQWRDGRTLEKLEERSEDNRERSKQAATWLDSAEEAIEARARVEEVDALREELSMVDVRLNRIETKQAGIARQQAGIERDRAELRGLANPAGYVAASAVGGYLVMLGALFVLAPGLLASAVIAGIVALFAIAFGVGVVIYTRGRGSALVRSHTEDGSAVPAD